MKERKKFYRKSLSFKLYIFKQYIKELKQKRMKKRELFLRKHYIKKLILMNKIPIDQVNKIINDCDFDYIIKYTLYYNNFMNIFLDLDKTIGREIDQLPDPENYIQEILHGDHFGLGLYIRNQYLYTKDKNKDINNIFDHYGNIDADHNSTIILYGYRFFKMGIFKIFK